MMPITMAGIGEKCKIQKIGGNEETRRFLANLGFVNDAEVSVIVCNRRKCDREHQRCTCSS